MFPEDWLSYFLPDEVELLISGGLNEIDIDDLRANTSLNHFDPTNKPEEKEYLDHFWAHLK